MFNHEAKGNFSCKETVRLKKNQIYLNELKVTMNKLRLIYNLRLVNGPIFIILELEITKLMKSIFMLQMENGNEAVIPKPLMMAGQRLPQSYHYYDWIYAIANNNINEVTKQNICQKILKNKKLTEDQTFSDKGRELLVKA